MGSTVRLFTTCFLALGLGLCGLDRAYGAAAGTDLSFVPEWMRTEGKRVGEDSSALLQVLPDYRDLNGMLKALLDLRGSQELKDLVYGDPDFASRDLSRYTFRLAEDGEELGFDLPLELAYLSLGLHGKYLAFVAAYGGSRLDGASVSRHLYTGIDAATLESYLALYSFTPEEEARIVCNLGWFANGDLAVMLAGRWKDALARDPGLVASVLDPAIERHDEALFDALLSALQPQDLSQVASLCVLHDFGYGFGKALVGAPDTAKALELAVFLSNAPFVEQLLPLNPRYRAGRDRANTVVDAAMSEGLPRNLYIYLLLLNAGYDDERRYVNAGLHAALTEGMGRVEMDLGLRQRLGDAFIAAGASINRVEPLYGPWLHWYASSSTLSLAYKKGMIRYLLSRGADPKARWQGLLYSEVPLSRHGLVNETGVRLRKDPDLRSEILQKLDKGTQVEILELGDTEITIDNYTGIWYRVSLKGGAKGWIFGKYIDYVE
jgi:hypothetical protein